MACPGYLKGELPGDYGFDPLRLGSTAEAFDRYFELELLHARWAMLGALGAVLPGKRPGALGTSALPDLARFLRRVTSLEFSKAQPIDWRTTTKASPSQIIRMNRCLGLNRAPTG